MSEEKPVRRTRSSDTFTPAINQALLEKLSEKALDRFFDVIESMVEAGRTDLMEGYAASIMAADFMHSAGLLSNSAYSAIFALENIMAGISAVDSVLGSITGTISPFAPSLKTYIDASGSKKKDDEEDEEEVKPPTSMSREEELRRGLTPFETHVYDSDLGRFVVDTPEGRAEAQREYDRVKARILDEISKGPKAKPKPVKEEAEEDEEEE